MADDATPRADRARQRADELWHAHGAGYYKISYSHVGHPPYIARCLSMRELLRLCALAELQEMDFARTDPGLSVVVEKGPAR